MLRTKSQVTLNIVLLREALGNTTPRNTRSTDGRTNDQDEFGSTSERLARCPKELKNTNRIEARSSAADSRDLGAHPEEKSKKLMCELEMPLSSELRVVANWRTDCEGLRSDLHRIGTGGATRSETKKSGAGCQLRYRWRVGPEIAVSTGRTPVAAHPSRPKKLVGGPGGESPPGACAAKRSKP